MEYAPIKSAFTPFELDNAVLLRAAFGFTSKNESEQEIIKLKNIVLNTIIVFFMLRKIYINV
jgi:hypothetical protein